MQGGEWLKTITSQRGLEAGKEFGDKFKELSADFETCQCYGPVLDSFLEHVEDLFGTIPEAGGEDRLKEVDSSFAVVLPMLLMLDETESMDSSTTRLCKLLTSITQHELRLRQLGLTSTTRFLRAWSPDTASSNTSSTYAAEANLFDHAMPDLGCLDAWMAD